MNFSKLTNLIDNISDIYGIPNCDCSVYYKHREVFRRRAGFTDSDRTKPASEDDLYWIYSASKVALATAAMQLAERGLISLNDPVEKYLPEFSSMMVKTPEGLVPCKRKATIEDLLSMRAGLNYDLTRADMLELVKNNPAAGLRDIVRQYLKAPLFFEPGTRFLYSMCLDVMGAIIEEVTGKSYGQYIKDNIAAPLGMKTLEYTIQPGMEERMVMQYHYNPTSQDSIDELEFVPIDKLSNVALFGSSGFECPGGGVITRVSDYVLLADALANDGVGANGAKILSRESIDNMRTNRLTTDILFADHAKMQNFGYGYGLAVRTLVNPKAALSPVGEFGWDGLGGAFLLSDVENNIAIFFLMSVTGMLHIKPAVHNKIRDFTYEALSEELKN